MSDGNTEHNNSSILRMHYYILAVKVQFYDSGYNLMKMEKKKKACVM